MGPTTAEPDGDPQTPGPLGSYIAQMGMRFASADGVTTGHLPVVGALCRAPGLVRIGALTVLADCVAGFDALSAFDMAWVGTSELAVHGPFRATAASEIVATGRLLKRRRTGGVFEVAIHDADSASGTPERPLATATATLSLLSQQRGTKLGSAIAEHAGGLSEVAPMRTLDELIRPRPLAGGGLSLEVTANVRNSWQVLSGGIAALLAELTAQAAATEALGRASVVDGLGLHFLAPGRVGPIEARAEVVSCPERASNAAAHLRVRLTDAGADGRQIVVASASARPLG